MSTEIPKDSRGGKGLRMTADESLAEADAAIIKLSEQRDELLAALKSIMEDDSPDWNGARAAIAKAKANP